MKSNKGFSLIEVVVGLSVFAFGILAIATVQTASVKNIGKSGSLNKDTFALNSFAEKIISLGYDSSQLSTGNHNVSLGRYLIFYNVKKHTDADNLKIVEIVQRNTNSKNEKSVTLYLSR